MLQPKKNSQYLDSTSKFVMTIKLWLEIITQLAEEPKWPVPVPNWAWLGQPDLIVCHGVSTRHNNSSPYDLHHDAAKP